MSQHFKSKKARPGRRHTVNFSPNTGRTKQAPADSTDLNKIMAKYTKTGILPGFNLRNPTYADYSETGDYQTTLQVVIDADNAFAELPSNVRERFQNDPGRFLEFMADARNEPEALNMGLLTPIEEAPSSLPPKETPAATPPGPPPTEPA